MIGLNDGNEHLPYRYLTEEAIWRKSQRWHTWTRIAMAVTAGLLMLLLCTLRSKVPLQRPESWSASSFNSTLGFGKIFQVGLPSMYTRRDEVSLLAYAHNLDITYFDAVDGRNLSLEQMPYGAKNLMAGELGCWRSHLNIWKRIIDEGIETALVVEDDIDFDVRIRSQMVNVRNNLIKLQKKLGRTRRSLDSSAAYPGSWEILWLGACFEDEIKFDGTKSNYTFVHYPDETVIDRSKRLPRWNDLEDRYRAFSLQQHAGSSSVWKLGGRYRILQQAQIPYCTTGYAISRRGAARLYYELSREIKGAVDMQMGWSSRKYESYVAIPEIFSPWKVHNTRNSFVRLSAEEVAESLHPMAQTDVFDPSIGTSANIEAEYSARHQLRQRILDSYR